MVRKLLNSQYIGRVRKLPPAIPAVKLSARSLTGKMAHRQYMARRSGIWFLVVLRMPNIIERMRLNMARKTPLSTTSRKKSIRKKKNEPLRVWSVSITKNLKNTG